MLCLWLVPRAGTFGAASATVLSYLAIFLCRSLQVRRILPFAQHGWRLGIATALLLLLALLIGNGAYRWGLLVALLSLLPFLGESIVAFRLVLRYLQDFFKKKHKYLDL